VHQDETSLCPDKNRVSHSSISYHHSLGKRKSLIKKNAGRKETYQVGTTGAGALLFKVLFKRILGLSYKRKNQDTANSKNPQQIKEPEDSNLHY